MEWLLILIWIGPQKGGITTERFSTEVECVKVGEMITKDRTTPLLSGVNFNCIEVTKLKK